MEIEDATGKKLSALSIFALAIKFLQEDLLKETSKSLSDGGLTAGEVHWVITVPAIWNDAAKQFMREAGERVIFIFHKLIYHDTNIGSC